MSATTSSASPLPAPTTTHHPWLAVAAVGLALFTVVTTEMLPIGLLTRIATSLDTSTGNAGLMLTLPALLAAVFAPLVVLLAGNLDRRRILCGLLALLVLANLASAFAPSLATMLVARALVGFCMGGIWAIAGGLAARLVPPAAIGLATALIFSGVAAASVLGIPLGALIGEAAGWRWAFGVMAGLSAVALALQLLCLPALPVSHAIRLGEFRHQLTQRPVRLGLLLTLLLVSGHFAAFTFVRPLLLTYSGFDAAWISPLLLAYGLTGIAGNFLAGLVVGRHTARTLRVIALGLWLTPLLLLLLGDSPWGGGLVLMLWGLAYGGVSVSLMTWMMRSAPQAIEVVTALYIGLFNTGIALGSWLGGWVVDAHGLTLLLGVAAALAAGAGVLSLGLGRLPAASASQ